jgi:tripartite-type tricarboxylate transporter receptor subunit TctC
MMKLPSCVVCAIAAFALLASSASRSAAADFPDRPMRLIIPFAVGGAVTFLTEQIVREMESDLGQSIVRDYRGGAGGTIAMELAAHAPHDGYTIFVLSTSQAISPGVYENLKVDVVKDFEPVVLLATTPYALVINPSIPADNVQQLVDYGKQHPGKLFLGTSGAGNSDDIIGYAFSQMTGCEMQHVPFRGAGPAVPELLAGRVNVSFFSPLPTQQFVKDGKLRMLGFTTKDHSPAMPEVPTVAEQGVAGFDFSGWYGLAVPAGTPATVVDVIRHAAVAALAKPSVAEYLRVNGLAPGGGPSADFKAFVASETVRWAQLAKSAGVKLQ